MGIQRAECIVSACMLKETTPVGARRSSGDIVFLDIGWSADSSKICGKIL